MKENKSVLVGVGAALSMMVLILDSKTAITGAYEGIILCLVTVIPSLFPFLILSGAVTASLSGRKNILLKPLGWLCRIPAGSEALLLTGLIGGYPVGAQCVSEAYRNGHLSKTEADRMLGFCNNAGPAFIFGLTGTLFQSRLIPWLLWLIHIASALAVGAVLPGSDPRKFSEERNITVNRTTSIAQSVRTMGVICGWIVIFRVLIAFCQRWFLWLFPAEIAVLFQGILELSNGCVALTAVREESIRFILCSTMLAFGGVCVWMQTTSVTAGLSTAWYIPGKLLQAGISCGISSALSLLLFPGEQSTLSPILICLGSCLIISCGVFVIKKSSSNRQKCVV